MYVVFAFDLETYNVEKQLYCEPYAAGVYHLNRLYDCFNRHLAEENWKLEERMITSLIEKTTTLLWT